MPPRPCHALATPTRHAHSPRPTQLWRAKHFLGPVPLDFSEDSSQGLRLTSLM